MVKLPKNLQRGQKEANMQSVTTVRISGDKLREARISRHLTQRELSIAANVSHETINRLERSTRSLNVYPLTMRKIADALGVEPGELLEE
jgi:transcriptional regulator with XRE-family HTH domain